MEGIRLMSANIKEFDIAIIGSGPGGEGAAVTLAANGFNVAIIEKAETVGGNSVHLGTIPSKALRHSAERMSEIETNPLFHHTRTEDHEYFKHIRNASRDIIGNIASQKKLLFKQLGITVIHGCAEFIDKQNLLIKRETDSCRIKSEKIIIAAGSHPYHPQEIDFSGTRIHDSDSILELENTPKDICIYGAGVIGCEYASIFNAIGCKVTLIDTREQLLSFLDHEISEALAFHMRSKGITIYHNEEFESASESQNSVTLKLKSQKEIKSEVLLWSNGRTGNSSKLKLENIGIKANRRGQLETDNNYRTTVENIYAVGDIIGFPSLASAAYDQGRFVARQIIDNNTENYLTDKIPSGIYTIPEISSIGLTEKELTEKKIPYKVGRANYKNLARAQIRGLTAGVLKILFHSETCEILGVHCFGYQASEILHIGQAVMNSADNNINYFTQNTFNYPTMAEAYRTAAVNGLME